MNIGKDLNISELLQAYDAVILVSEVILLGSAILDIRTLGQLTCCARLPFPSPFHCLPQNWTNLLKSHNLTIIFDERKVSYTAVLTLPLLAFSGHDKNFVPFTIH